MSQPLPGGAPRGADAVRTALCRATESLCADRPPGSVTVREIAAAAGVNHGLVHHYFGSKPALLGAAMHMIELDFDEELAAHVDADALVGAFFDGVERRPSYPRLLSWLLLEGARPADVIAGFPLVDRIRRAIAAGTDPTEAALRTQSLLAFVAGWATMHDFVGDAVDLSPAERAEASAVARRHAVAIARGDLPSRSVAPPLTRP